MNKLGKEAKVLLYGITITCVISFLLAFGISSLMAKEYQKDLMQHDYFMAGYLLNHSDALELSAFTAEQNENDIETGRNALEAIGYDDSLSEKLLPSVLPYRNRAMIALFFLLLFAFGIVYVLVVYYLNRQHKAIKGAENSIREFLDGNTMCRIESEETGDWYALFVSMTPCELYERKVTMEQLHAAIAALPDKQAKRIYAYYFLGLTESAIAKSEGVSVASVSESIQRGLRNMETFLKNRL